MSTGPRRSVTDSSIPFTCAGSVPSTSTAMALPPEVWISSATASERSRVRAASATPAPTSTSAFAKASPRPVLPPVTTAVLPVRSKASRTANKPPLFSTRTVPWGAVFRLPTLHLTSLSEQNNPRHGAEDAADDRPHDRDPGVPPVITAFARDGQHGVGYTRPQVAGGVDSVAGRTTEREPDAYDEQADDQRVQAAPYYHRGTARDRPRVRNDAKDAEDQHEGADDLGDEVRRGVVDGRRGREHAELETFVLGLRPVRQVGQPHDDGTHEGPEELRDDVSWHQAPGELASYGIGDGHGGVDVGAGELAHAIDGHGHGQPPSEGDDDPARVLGLGVPQQHPCDHAVAEDDQDHGPDKLTDVCLHRSLPSRKAGRPPHRTAHSGRSSSRRRASVALWRTPPSLARSCNPRRRASAKPALPRAPARRRRGSRLRRVPSAVCRPCR